MLENRSAPGPYRRLPSAFVFLVAAGVLCAVFHKVSTHQLIEGAERANVALTRSFANALWGMIDNAIERSGGLNGDQLRARAVSTHLNIALGEQMEGLSVLKIKLYNTAGTTIYSTEPSQIGISKSGSLGFQTAMTGRVASELGFRDSFNSLEGIFSDRDVVSSYIPLQDSSGRILGVFEIYDDVTEPLAAVRYVQRVTFGLIGLICAVLFGAILTFIERGQSLVTNPGDPSAASAPDGPEEQSPTPGTITARR